MVKGQPVPRTLGIAPLDGLGLVAGHRLDLAARQERVIQNANRPAPRIAVGSTASGHLLKVGRHHPRLARQRPKCRIVYVAVEIG
jgi:hypothetical protein